MGKFITKFETTAAYTTAESTLAMPNVSLTKDNMQVHYIPMPSGPEAVDLGLPSGTKWAKYNVGATSETEYGNYYQYGKGSAQYAATSGRSNYSGTENPLAISADTAAQVWGGNWHMPTSAQCQELTANTTYEWTTINGVNGGKFTAQNGNYIFFPARGSYQDGNLKGTGSLVWSSTPNLTSTGNAYNLRISNTSCGVSSNNRNRGFSVRAVLG